MTQGPNVRKLIATRMSSLMIPPGSGPNALGVGLAALAKPGNLVAVAKEATAWVEAAILAVRQASPPNPWAAATDEDIAVEVLRQVEEKQRRMASRVAGRPLAARFR